jgi:dTDP-4-dehydrorhamnose 3,5-epimerase-like enzyme
MVFAQADIPDVMLITPEPIPDERGTFTQLWGLKEFEATGSPHTWSCATGVSTDGRERCADCTSSGRRMLKPDSPQSL